MKTPPHWDGAPREHLFGERSLWLVIAVPTVWAAHFLLCYWAAAIWCAKIAPEGANVLPLRLAIAAITLVALGTIALLARHARRRYHGHLIVEEEMTKDTEAERTRFLGNASLLLAVVSSIAVIFGAMPAVVFDACF